MTLLDRRSFASSALLAAGGAVLLPAWFREAFGLQEPLGPGAKKPLRRRDHLLLSARRALEEGKPLLVLVVPAKERLYEDRAHRLGRWLLSANEEHRLDLGLFVLSCATTTDVSIVFGRADELDRLPLLVWIDVSGFEAEGAARPRILPIDVELETWSSFFERRRRGELRDGETVESYEADGIEKIARALRSAIAQQDADLARLAADMEGKLDKPARAELQRWIANGAMTSGALLCRATAQMRRSIHALEPDIARARTASLAAAIAIETTTKRIAGSAWARSLPCAFEIEQPETEAERRAGSTVACGMSFFPEPSRRFLYFFTDPPK